MFLKRRSAIAAVIVATLLVTANTAGAGPILNWLGIGDDPPSSYPKIRYWAPTVARVGDAIHHRTLSVYPPDRHPEIPPTFTVIQYHNSVASPAETMIPRPKPPETSRAE